MVTFSRRTFGVAADPAWVGSLWRRIIDHALDAILHERRVEVEQEPHAATGEAQLGELPRLMDGEDLLDRLELHDDEIFNQQVDAVAIVDQGAAIPYWQKLLTLYNQPRSHQLMGQAPLVGRLQQTRPKGPMYRNSRQHHRLAHLNSRAASSDPQPSR